MKIPISQIKIEREDANKKRFRRDLGAIQEMVESLKKHGLIQPVVIEPTEDGYKLVAGERRITAAAYLGWQEIECTFRENLSDVQRKELELEENIQRRELSPEEISDAFDRLDRLRNPSLLARILRFFVNFFKRLFRKREK